MKAMAGDEGPPNFSSVSKEEFNMRAKLVAILALVGGMTISSLASHAVTIPAPVGPLETDMAFTRHVSGGATGGAAVLSFDVLGYNSLDGVNFYQDNFIFTLNGIDILNAAFDLGGGGTNQIFKNLMTGYTQTGGSAGVGSGGSISIAGLINLLAGDNVLTFGYASLATPQNAGFQGLGDEGWGIGKLDVTAAAVLPSAVPLPPAGFLFGAGLCGLFSLAGRPKNRKAV
jgi:hypothetical protein